MNTIKQLIEKYCPEGVEYKKLEEIADIMRGERITKKDLISIGGYPVMSGGKTFFGRYPKYNREANTITIAQYGSAGYISFIKERFWANDVCYSIFPQNIDNKYLYYSLCSNQRLIYSLTTKAIPDCLPKDRLADVDIPVPPIEVQHEIVRILDNFTSLEAELEAELEARRKQYEYYRDQLLSFKHLTGGGSNVVEWKTLGEITTKVFAGRNREKLSAGTYPVYGSTGIIAYSNAYQYDKELILIARVGANAGFVNIAKGNYDVSDNTLIVEPQQSINLKYLFYVLQNMNINKYAKGGGQPLITAGLIKKFNIPIPSELEQHRIVSILDRFESLVNDITTGLPAEIAARHQQYEYYRDQLLTFKRKS